MCRHKDEQKHVFNLKETVMKSGSTRDAFNEIIFSKNSFLALKESFDEIKNVHFDISATE